MRPLLPAIFALALCAAPALAFDDSDASAVRSKVADFESAVRSQNYSVFFDTIPPKMLDFIAEQAQLPPAELKAAMGAQIQTAMSSVTIEQFEIDLDAMETGDTSSGRGYAIIPTTSTVSVPNIGKTRSTNTTLALEDDGAWYLVRMDNPQQIAVLRSVYPDFEGIVFPQGTMEAVQ